MVEEYVLNNEIVRNEGIISRLKLIHETILICFEEDFYREYIGKYKVINVDINYKIKYETFDKKRSCWS